MVRPETFGPYYVLIFLFYRELLEKTNVTWNQNNTISFQKFRRWYFDAETSNGSLKDYVTTLNPVAAVSIQSYDKKFIIEENSL